MLSMHRRAVEDGGAFGVGGGDFVGESSLTAVCDLADHPLRLVRAVGEQRHGLLLGGELAELALEVDAAHQSCVKAVGVGFEWWATWGFEVGGFAVADRGAFGAPVFEADAGESRSRRGRRCCGWGGWVCHPGPFLIEHGERNLCGVKELRAMLGA